MKEWICRELSTSTGNSENGVLMRETELIRCKDCKYWQLEHYVGGQGMSCQMDNSDDVCLTEPTHFCGWAERKDD